MNPPESSFRLDGMTAVVTGASRNIGAAIAAAFAGAGADLALVARTTGPLDEMAGKLRAEHPERRIVSVAGDVGSGADVECIIAAISDEFASVDVLVNNAAVWGPGREGAVLDVSDDEWSDVLGANLLGPYRLIAGLVGGASAERPASVINVLSGAGFQPSVNAMAYGVSKAALWMLTRYLAVELAPTVRVNALVPGIISEDGQPRWSGHQDLLDRGAVPLGRMGLPTEMVGAALYLASPASSYTTGTVIFCNGGTLW